MIPSLTPLAKLRRRIAIALAISAGVVLPLVEPATRARAGGPGPAPAGASGYWMVASDGGIFAYGAARFLGSTGAVKLNMPIVGMAATPTGHGYWLVAADGGIFAFGDAGFFGSTGGMHLNRLIVGMAASPSGKGYWLVASDGGVFSFGDAPFYGSTGAIKLNNPIIGMTRSAAGRGYRMVGSDGGVFSFGDAAFYGSATSAAREKPIAGMATTASGEGYWLLGSDGSLLPFGDATSLGSATAMRAVAAMAATPTGGGYWVAGDDGSLATFGDALDLGHPTGTLTSPIVGLAVVSVPATLGAGSPATPAKVVPGSGATATTTPTTVPDSEGAVPHSTRRCPSRGPTGRRRRLSTIPAIPFASRATTSPCTWKNAKYAEELRSLARIGNRLFIGGFFHELIDHSSPPPGAPYVKPVAYLAELDALTGRPAAEWTFTGNAAPDASVAAMAVSPDGRRLYIGGRFTRAGGGAAVRLAALDLQTGLLDPTFNPPAPDSTVYSIVPHGDRVYIGGGFLRLGSRRSPGWPPSTPATGASSKGGHRHPTTAARSSVRPGTPPRRPRASSTRWPSPVTAGT